MKWTILILLFAVGMVIWPMACSQLPMTIPNSPAPRSIYTQIFTVTNTPTISPTPTITRSPTPTPTGKTATATFTATPSPTGSPVPTNTPNANCPTNADVTSYIDGADYVGNDTGHTISAGIPLDHGGTYIGDVLTFTLTTAKTLNFSLCPTEDLSRATIMYIRSDCTNISGESFNLGYCAGLPQIVNLSLSAGTYYIILAESGGDGPAPYALRIKSGSTASPICTVVASASPVNLTPGTHMSCSASFAFNGGVTASGQRIGTGNLDDTTNTDDFYTFVPAVSGTATITLDCFDNGLNNVDFDIYAADTCPGSGKPPLLGQSATTDPVEQFTFAVTAGTTYYVDVEAYLGTGPYRLTVQTP